jgi:hypothetical protein
MANTTIQLKRSSVAGKTPNTVTLSTGELAINLTDKKLYSSDGTNIFEPAGNVTNINITGGIKANGSFGTAGQILTSNGTATYWSTVSGGGGFTNGQSISVNNFVITGAFTANSSNGTSGQVLTSNGTATYWASTIAPRVNTATSTATLAWNSDNYEQYQLTALAENCTISADSATPVNGRKIIFRFEDNGTARSLTWTNGVSNSFRVIGTTLPTTTVANKTAYVGAIYNSTDSRWDVIAVAQEA